MQSSSVGDYRQKIDDYDFLREMGCHNSAFLVDVDTLKENYKKVQRYIGGNVNIIPVLKGNCYGYGLVEMAKIFTRMCGAKIVANAAVYEAVQLRNAGIDSEILIIGGVPLHLLPYVVDNNLQINVFNRETAGRLNDLAAEKGRTMKVHIKIETGMNRLGVKPGEPLQQLLDYLKTLENVRIVGAYTHFATSTAEYYDAFALEQFDKFKDALKQFKDNGIGLTYVHCCNSSATTWFKEAYCSHIRSSSSILGHDAMEDGREPIGLIEPVAIKAFITNIHRVYPGESVGYSRYFKPEKQMDIATISIGFADGIYPPYARLGGPVIVSGVRTKFVGICMDQAFVDVTGIDCKIGQAVTLIGREGSERITTRDVEVFTGQTFEYLFCSLGDRVARIYY